MYSFVSFEIELLEQYHVFLQVSVKNRKNRKVSICKCAAFHFRNANISYAVESDIYETSAVKGVIAL